MNNESKLMLSDEEQELVNDTHWILTKRIVIEKISARLGALTEEFKFQAAHAKENLPLVVVQTSPKIARGENYLQLPYVLLDYPRFFAGPDIFAVRTLFWWGHFFSISLLLSGKYKEMYQQQLIKNLTAAETDWFICIHSNQWHHHFETDNMVLVKTLSDDQIGNIIEQKEFVKIAIKFPLHQWNEANKWLDKFFIKLIELLND